FVMDHRFLLRLYHRNWMQYDTNNYNKTILNLVSRGNDSYQPATVIPREVWVYHRTFWHNLTLPILTCKPMGRLGNIMGEYASLYALHQHYNVTVVLHPLMKQSLGNIFPHLTIPDFQGDYDDITWKTVSNIESLYNYAPIELAASGLLGASHFEISNFPFEIQLFHRFKTELKNEFRFSSHINTYVQTFLNKITEIWHSWMYVAPVFIGFHVRRTDYAEHAK
ncbi:hypothetical protein SK128_004972, partial [Halocaridina rubra]